MSIITKNLKYKIFVSYISKKKTLKIFTFLLYRVSHFKWSSPISRKTKPSRQKCFRWKLFGSKGDIREWF